MLSKGECEKALKTIEIETTEIEDNNSIPTRVCNPFGSEISLLKQLIKEHFDYSPLSFDELQKAKGGLRK